MLEQHSSAPARVLGAGALTLEWGPPWDKAGATKLKLKIVLSEREVLRSVPSQNHAKNYSLGTLHTEDKVFGFILTDKKV